MLRWLDRLVGELGDAHLDIERIECQFVQLLVERLNPGQRLLDLKLQLLAALARLVSLALRVVRAGLLVLAGAALHLLVVGCLLRLLLLGLVSCLGPMTAFALSNWLLVLSLIWMSVMIMRITTRRFWVLRMTAMALHLRIRVIISIGVLLRGLVAVRLASVALVHLLFLILARRIHILGVLLLLHF